MTIATEPGFDLADDALYAADPDAPEDAEEAPADGQLGPDIITPEAPFGYTRDRSAPGGWRPKKAPGRPRLPRTPEEIAAEPPPPRTPDEPPRQGAKPLPPADEDVPMPAGGTIARKVNKFYRRAGRVLKNLDEEVGVAFIECTRKEDADDVTVGEAWEALAKDNPRIRAWLLNFVKGGTWQDLALAHASIAAAIFMRRWLLEHIPFMGMVASWFERDEDDQADDSEDGGRGAAELLEAADVEAMAGVHSDVMRRAGSNVTIKRMAAKLADGSASLADLEHLDPELVAAAQKMASQGVPPGLRRHQPKSTTRRKRRR
jgi:hypothetical protein